MNTRRVKCDHLSTPKTPQNTNSAGDRGHGRGPQLGRRTFIDDLVDITNSSTKARYQEIPIRRSPADPGVPASGSTVENTRAAATPSNTLAEEDKVSTAGSVDRGSIYHINGKVVTEEEWTQFHKKFVDQWKDEEKNEEEKTEEGMSNRHESDEEEAMGENHHHEGHSLPEGMVATLQFPIQ